MDEALVKRVAEDIRLWTGVELPNETGRQMASMDIPKLTADFEALRGKIKEAAFSLSIDLQARWIGKLHEFCSRIRRNRVRSGI